MLGDVVSERQNNWDGHPPPLAVANCASLHGCTGSILVLCFDKELVLTDDILVKSAGMCLAEAGYIRKHLHKFCSVQVDVFL